FNNYGRGRIRITNRTQNRFKRLARRRASQCEHSVGIRRSDATGNRSRQRFLTSILAATNDRDRQLLNRVVPLDGRVTGRQLTQAVFVPRTGVVVAGATTVQVNARVLTAEAAIAIATGAAIRIVVVLIIRNAVIIAVVIVVIIVVVVVI